MSAKFGEGIVCVGGYIKVWFDIDIMGGDGVE